jgi:hypothetical protein
VGRAQGAEGEGSWASACWTERERRKKSWGPREEYFLFAKMIRRGKRKGILSLKEIGVFTRDETKLGGGLRREFREELGKDPKELETYSNEKVEKGFASPLR